MLEVGGPHFLAPEPRAAEPLCKPGCKNTLAYRLPVGDHRLDRPPVEADSESQEEKSPGCRLAVYREVTPKLGYVRMSHDAEVGDSSQSRMTKSLVSPI